MLSFGARQPAAWLGWELSRLIDSISPLTGTRDQPTPGVARFSASLPASSCIAFRQRSTASSAGENDLIHISGMRFFGHHGVLPEETGLGQSFVVDVKLGVDTSVAGTSDALQDTVNYAEVYGDIKAVVEGPPYQLLEAVAHKAVGAVLRLHPAVQHVDFTIRKLSIPGMPSVVESVGVQILRRRS